MWEWMGWFSQMHRLLPVWRWEEFHQTAGVEVEGGGMAMEAGGVRHCHTAWAADLQSWGCCFFPLPHPNVSISFSSQAPERSAESCRGSSSHILTPYCSPSHIHSPHSPRRLLSFKNLSPYYPYLFLPLLLSGGKASNPDIQVLVSAAPFSSVVTLSLSLRCPSAALTTPPLRINQAPNEPK